MAALPEGRGREDGLRRLLRGSRIDALALRQAQDERGASHFLSRWLFLRVVAAIYAIAFLSIYVQLDGLIGSEGILPAHEFLEAVAGQLGPERFWRFPTVFWLGAGDQALHLVCGGGIALAALAVTGIAPAFVFAVLWALYLSLVTVGGDFLEFQWDILLLEAGFLAIFLSPLGLRPGLGGDPPKAIVWLVRWLLFRLMFSSGAVKLLSGDPTWRDLTALRYHYWTQPLPTWISWYANLLPDWFQTLSCALMFAVELGAPALIVAPQGYRLAAFFALVSLQVLICLTGNYCFFNLLAIALCLMLLEDTVWPERLRRRIETARSRPRREWPRFVVVPVTALIVMLSILRTFDLSRAGGSWPEPLARVRRLAAPFGIVNGYGLFAVMTTTRPEIIVEGSDDGESWKEYEFRWKAGDLSRAPAFVEPHQPRLDWQMWFAALAPFRQSPWFLGFVHRLLEGSQPVTALLAENPFPDGPPRYIRAMLYDYTFTDLAERRATGHWWRREAKGAYLPAVSLESFR